MEEELLKHFCQHLIGIGWYEGKVDESGGFVGQPVFCNASGFLLQLHSDVPSSCVLVTAGHVITDHKKRMSKPKMGAKNHRLFDFWGPRSVESPPIPFDFFDADSYVVYDKEAGIDLAFIQLPYLVFIALLDTITPFRKSNWVHQQKITYESYTMLGLPSKMASQFHNRREGVGEITTCQNPVLLLLEECELPTGTNAAESPQFVGQIDPRADLEDIKGMSGGPIFGFRKSVNGQTAYWPVAIQSRWLPKKRIVIGTLIEPVAAEFEQKTNEVLTQRFGKTR